MTWGKRLVPTLLLREARYVMLASVIDNHPAAVSDGKAARGREAGIVQIVLRAGRGGAAEFGWPPVI